LAKARGLVSDGLKEVLLREQRLGRDASASLIRRHIWVFARIHDMKIKGLYDAAPEVDWARAEKVCDAVKRWHDDPKNRQLAATNPDTPAVSGRTDPWHTDPNREHVAELIQRYEAEHPVKYPTKPAPAEDAGILSSATGWFFRNRSGSVSTTAPTSVPSSPVSSRPSQ